MDIAASTALEGILAVVDQETSAVMSDGLEASLKCIAEGLEDQPE